MKDRREGGGNGRRKGKKKQKIKEEQKIRKVRKKKGGEKKEDEDVKGREDPSGEREINCKCKCTLPFALTPCWSCPEPALGSSPCPSAWPCQTPQ